MTFTIRSATSNDAAAIADHNCRLAFESEGKTLDPAVSLAGVRAALADPDGKGPYFLACDGQTVVGQCQVTREWSDWRNAWFWWFQSVYVRKDYRSRGIFRAIYEYVRQKAVDAEDVMSLRLYVERGNDSARATYERLGMRIESYDIMHEPLIRTKNRVS